jgi:hypothetical protein
MIVDAGLQSLHVSAAVKHGLELFSYSQAIICEGFKPQYENNFVLSYLQIETDRRETAFVSVFGISAHFLTMIAPAVLEAIRNPAAVLPKPRLGK